MAITIHSEPLTYTPSDNPITWVFSSNQTGQPNFSFYIEIFVNSILKTTAMVFPRNGSRAMIDVSNMCRISCNSAMPINTLTDDAANNGTVYIKIYERYGTTPALQSNITTGTKTFFKACLAPDYFLRFNNENYVWGTDPAEKRFLTIYPHATNRFKCAINENLFFYFITNNANNLKYKIDLRDANNDSIIVEDVSLSTTPKIIALNASPQAIINNTSITQQDFDNCVFYRIWITNSTETKNTNVMVVEVDRDCSKYDKERFYFLNSFGGIDAFTFTKKRKHTTEIERKEVLQSWGKWDDSNNFSYSNKNRIVNYQNISSDKIEINSDWINRDIQNWLVSEMYESTNVMISEGAQYIQVSLVNSSYELKNDEDELIRENVTFKLGNTRTKALR